MQFIFARKKANTYEEQSGMAKQHYTLQDLRICYRALLLAVGHPRYSEERHEKLKEYVAIWKCVEPAAQTEFMVFLRNYISVTQLNDDTRQKMIALANSAGPIFETQAKKRKRS